MRYVDTEVQLRACLYAARLRVRMQRHVHVYVNVYVFVYTGTDGRRTLHEDVDFLAAILAGTFIFGYSPQYYPAMELNPLILNQMLQQMRDETPSPEMPHKRQTETERRTERNTAEQSRDRHTHTQVDLVYSQAAQNAQNHHGPGRAKAFLLSKRR